MQHSSELGESTAKQSRSSERASERGDMKRIFGGRTSNLKVCHRNEELGGRHFQPRRKINEKIEQSAHNLG